MPVAPQLGGRVPQDVLVVQPEVEPLFAQGEGVGAGLAPAIEIATERFESRRRGRDRRPHPFAILAAEASHGHPGLLDQGEPGRAHRSGARLLRDGRSEEHTSELQSRRDLVCRLLLEKKKKKKKNKKNRKQKKTRKEDIIEIK